MDLANESSGQGDHGGGAVRRYQDQTISRQTETRAVEAAAAAISSDPDDDMP